MTMSIADLLDDWFESPQVKAAMAINGVIGTWAGPYEPGTAYVMAHHSIGDVGDGKLGSWGYPEGGMGAVSDQIRASAVESGATVRTNARVEHLLVKRGRVSGAVLAGGEEVLAPDRGQRDASADHVPASTSTAASCPRTSSPTSSAGGRAAASSRSTSRSRSCPTSPPTRGATSRSTTPDPSRWRRRWSGSRRRFRKRARAVRRRDRSPTASSPPRSIARCARRARTSCRCSRSGCRTSGPTRRTPRSWRRTRTG